jgi:hypothetical protein
LRKLQVKNMFYVYRLDSKGKESELERTLEGSEGEDLSSRTAWGSSFPTFSRTSPRKVARTCVSLSLSGTKVRCLNSVLQHLCSNV